MIDWTTFHRFAEDVELWSTLAINLWALAAALYFVVGRLVGPKVSSSRSIFQALIFGMVCVDIGLSTAVAVAQPPNWIWMIAANIAASALVVIGMRTGYKNSN